MDADGAETADCVHCWWGGVLFVGWPLPAGVGGVRLAGCAEWDVVMRVGGFGKVSGAWGGIRYVGT